MVYFNTYHRKHKPLIPNTRSNPFSEASYELVDQLRQGLDLPDFHKLSLNRAWPLGQGVNGGMTIARRCGNPECQRPKSIPENNQRKRRKFDLLENSEYPDFLPPTPRLTPLAGSLSVRLCAGCHSFAMKHSGEMRSREGTSNGFFPQELGLASQLINLKWLERGNPAKCTNPACGVNIPRGANLYGFRNGIRYQKCHSFAREVKRNGH
jgi:hypothetical protein